jgi:hypothetical protein
MTDDAGPDGDLSTRVGAPAVVHRVFDQMWPPVGCSFSSFRFVR